MLLGHQVFKLQAKRIKLNLLLKLSFLNRHFTLPLGYLNPALNNPALGSVGHTEFDGIYHRVWVMKCTITGGYLTWLLAESVLQNTSLFSPDSCNAYGWCLLKMDQIMRATPAELRTIVQSTWRSIGYTTICASNCYIRSNKKNSDFLIQQKINRLNTNIY